MTGHCKSKPNNRTLSDGSACNFFLRHSLGEGQKPFSFGSNFFVSNFLLIDALLSRDEGYLNANLTESWVCQGEALCNLPSFLDGTD